jgi:hypothetical protein
MGELNIERANSLLEAVEQKGGVATFSQKEIEEGRKRYLASSEKSEIEERFRRAKALEESSRIFLTL